MLKSNFFSKNKNFRNTLFEYIPALVISFLLHNNLIRKVWVDLKNERQHKTQSFLAKKSKSPWNKPISRAMSASQELQLLEI